MKAILSVLVLFAVTACASKKEEREIQAKAKESKVSDGKALGSTISDLIHSSKTLSDAQKKELENIMLVNKETADKLMEQSFKLRSVLIKELLSGKTVNQKEINLIKKDIEKVENARLKNTFDTVEKITNIVSAHPEQHKIIDHVIFMERLQR